MKKNVLQLMAALMFLGIIGSALAQDDGPLANLKFLVIRDTDGKPVRNAEVVLHPVKRKGKQANGEMELKTDAEGHASIEGIPYGPLRVQVLAPHFQTFGEDYQVDKAEMEIVVKMKHPDGQYSIYDNHGDDKKPQ